MTNRVLWVRLLAAMILMVAVIAPAFAALPTCCGCCAKEEHPTCACALTAPEHASVEHPAVFAPGLPSLLVAILPPAGRPVVVVPIQVCWLMVEHPERGPPGPRAASSCPSRAPPHA